MKLRTWSTVGAIVVFGLIVAYGFTRRFDVLRDHALFNSVPKPIVAILDTGLSMDADARFASAVVGADIDRVDKSGHGTRLAKVILDVCPVCLILPLRVTEDGSADGTAVSAASLARGVTRALEADAAVINISNGVLSDEMSADAAEPFAEAARRGIPVVAAAGHGVPNPFRPIPLSTLFPQRLTSVFVVGAADVTGRLESTNNFGPELFVAVSETSGSSFAAARVSAWIALLRPPVGRSIEAFREWMIRSTESREHDGRRYRWLTQINLRVRSQ